MKLVIQIPCLNEEKSLPITVKDLPRSLPGFDQVEYLVIDDGSTDQTVAVARSLGVHHIVSQVGNKGLAKSFMLGLRTAVKLGADVIVNTDADNQYDARDIEKIVQPILEGKAEIVVGSRAILKTKQWSFFKKILQLLGSWAVRLASRTNIADAPSGFRAFSRSAAMRMEVFSEYTYTLETIIQAGQKGISITSVPVRTNPDLRPSRLVKSIGSYVRKSLVTMVRIFIVYRPFRFFALLGGVLFLIGFILGVRFLVFYFMDEGSGHTQSLILASLLMSMGFFTGMAGVLADLISVNRKLLEEISLRLWKLEEKEK